MNAKLLKLSGPCAAILIIFLLNSVTLTGQVKISEQEWTIPTYKVSPPDKNPMFFKGESYQGASKYIYPYGMNDVIANENQISHGKHLSLKTNILNCVLHLRSAENFIMGLIKPMVITSFIKMVL